MFTTARNACTHRRNLGVRDGAKRVCAKPLSQRRLHNLPCACICQPEAEAHPPNPVMDEGTVVVCGALSAPRARSVCVKGPRTVASDAWTLALLVSWSVMGYGSSAEAVLWRVRRPGSRGRQSILEAHRAYTIHAILHTRSSSHRCSQMRDVAVDETRSSSLTRGDDSTVR